MSEEQNKETNEEFKIAEEDQVIPIIKNKYLALLYARILKVGLTAIMLKPNEIRVIFPEFEVVLSLDCKNVYFPQHGTSMLINWIKIKMLKGIGKEKTYVGYTGSDCIFDIGHDMFKLAMRFTEIYSHLKCLGEDL